MNNHNLSKHEIEEIKQEMLSKVDKKIVKKIMEVTVKGFNDRFDETYKLHKDCVDKYLSIWADKKWRLYLLLGRNLICRQETKYAPSDNMMVEVVKIISVAKVERRVGGQKIMVDTPQFRYYIPIVKLFSAKDIIDNICPKDDTIMSLIGDTYKPGQKLSRFFSKFFDDENFDIQYSKILQNNFLNQYINLSIDPVDLLTVGTSNSFHNSCYNVTKFYQGAGYGFMCDETSVVAFLSREEPEKICEIGEVFLNKINRAVVDIRKDFRQICFNGIIVSSFREQIDKYVDMLYDIISKYIGDDNFEKFECLGDSDIERVMKFNHICDDAGPCYLSGDAKMTMVSPGSHTLYDLSDPSVKLNFKEYDEDGWMIEGDYE